MKVGNDNIATKERFEYRFKSRITRN